MAEYYFSGKTDRGTELCIAPVTERHLELSGQAEEIEDRSGYFLYELRANQTEVEILARIASPEAALRLSALLALR